MEATPEETAEGLDVVRVLAAVLDRLLCANARLARADPGQVTKFHAMKAPGIAIQKYLERILKYASCSNQCFILALVYIDRLIQRNNFLLTELNVHRVVITSVLLAAKFFDDAYYNNAYYAKVGGVLVSEINGLEVDFLFRINFSLHVSPEEFEKYRAELMSNAAATAVAKPVACPAQVSPEVHAVNDPLAIFQSATAAASQITSCPPVIAIVQDPVHKKTLYQGCATAQPLAAVHAFPTVKDTYNMVASNSSGATLVHHQHHRRLTGMSGAGL